MSMDYQAEDRAFHEEVAKEIKGMAFTSCTGNVYVDALRTLKSRADEAYQEGYSVGQIEMAKEAAYICMQRAEEARLRKDHWDGLDEVDYEISYAEALEAEACAAAIRALDLGVDVDARSNVCQCGYGKRGQTCKMSCPGSEVEP